jgi:hypothetical protein
MATRLEDADLTDGQRLLLRALAGSPLRDAFYLTGGSNLARASTRTRARSDRKGPPQGGELECVCTESE